MPSSFLDRTSFEDGKETVSASPPQQLLKLELENAVLRTELEVRMLEQKNLRLQALLSGFEGRVDPTKMQMHSTLSPAAPRPVADGAKHTKSIGVMQRMLAQTQMRGVEIRRNYEQRARGLTMQINQERHEIELLSQAQLNVGAIDGVSASMQQKVLESRQKYEEAQTRRENLLRQLRELDVQQPSSGQGDASIADSMEISTPEVNVRSPDQADVKKQLDKVMEDFQYATRSNLDLIKVQEEDIKRKEKELSTLRRKHQQMTGQSISRTTDPGHQGMREELQSYEAKLPELLQNIADLETLLDQGPPAKRARRC